MDDGLFNCPACGAFRPSLAGRDSTPDGPVDDPVVAERDRYREALRRLDGGWKDFYDRNVGSWDDERHGRLTLGNYVRSVLDGE